MDLHLYHGLPYGGTMMKPAKHEAHGSVLSYSVGFILSVVMTLSAYIAVVNRSYTGDTLAAFVVGLAIAQLLVQLLFFLHLGSETRPRWKLLVFMFMVVVVAIVVIGSIWIMYNLDYNMMPAHEIDQNVMEEEGIYH